MSVYNPWEKQTEDDKTLQEFAVKDNQGLRFYPTYKLRF